MSKTKLFQQWMIAYPHLTVLILTTPTLPRPIQADVSRALLKVVDEWTTRSHKLVGSQPSRVNPYWNYFLYHHHRHQWTEACPDLHEALSKLDTLPPAILLALDQGCEGLNTYLQIQTLTQTICVLESRRQVFHCLSVSEDLIQATAEKEMTHRNVVSFARPMASFTHAV